MVYIIGTGMEGIKTLTKEAFDTIEKSEIIIGSKRLIHLFENSEKTLICSYKTDEIIKYLKKYEKSEISVLMSGDCGFFSGTKKLLPLLKDIDFKIISGISSAVYLCSKTGISYENMKYITLHGKSQNIAVNVKLNEFCFFLLGGEIKADKLCRILCDYNLDKVKIYIGENLGYENEKIYKGRAIDFVNTETENLCVLLTENPEYLRYIPSAIADSEFIRTKIPMTKSEVRCNIISGLNINKDSICWDIGCGTGSVSIEMAYRCFDGKVFSFDKNPEAVKLTLENSHKFGCDNITVTEGKCPEVLDKIPVPDKIFIGGTSGNIGDIFKIIKDKNPYAEITVTAISLETLGQAVETFKEFNSEYSITQLSISKAEKVGNYNMLKANNPVFIIRGRLI